MKTKTLYIIPLLLLITFISCNKDKYYDGEHDPLKIKGYKNENYYSSKMDSLEAIYHITEQKLQEVYDLSALATNNKNNKQIDTLIISQIKSYFAPNDKIYAQKTIKEIDSLNAIYVKIELVKDNNAGIDSVLTDSSGQIKYKVHFYNSNKKYFLSRLKKADYILKKNTNNNKNQFKFYFSKIENIKE